MPRFQPRYVSITLAAACTTLASHATLALSCALSGGGEELKEPLDKVIVVDRSPAGSEIWRSPVKHAAVRCDFDQARAGWSERIYFYPNPRNATPVPNVEFGVLYKKRGVLVQRPDRHRLQDHARLTRTERIRRQLQPGFSGDHAQKVRWRHRPGHHVQL